jgi:hypothetical protein
MNKCHEHNNISKDKNCISIFAYTIIIVDFRLSKQDIFRVINGPRQI